MLRPPMVAPSGNRERSSTWEETWEDSGSSSCCIEQAHSPLMKSSETAPAAHFNQKDFFLSNVTHPFHMCFLSLQPSRPWLHKGSESLGCSFLTSLIIPSPWEKVKRWSLPILLKSLAFSPPPWYNIRREMQPLTTHCFPGRNPGTSGAPAAGTPQVRGLRKPAALSGLKPSRRRRKRREAL